MNLDDKGITIKLLADCEEHIPTLAVLYYEELARSWNPNASTETTKQTLINHLNKDKMPLTFIALHQNEPIGIASLRENDGIRPDLLPWLGGLVVDPRYRGLGVGEKLIDAVKFQAIQWKYKTLYLLAYDKTIPRWYASLGWEVIGADELHGHPVTVMRIYI